MPPGGYINAGREKLLKLFNILKYNVIGTYISQQSNTTMSMFKVNEK